MVVKFFNKWLFLDIFNCVICLLLRFVKFLLDIFWIFMVLILLIFNNIDVVKLVVIKFKCLINLFILIFCFLLEVYSYIVL